MDNAFPPEPPAWFTQFYELAYSPRPEESFLVTTGFFCFLFFFFVFLFGCIGFYFFGFFFIFFLLV